MAVLSPCLLPLWFHASCFFVPIRERHLFWNGEGLPSFAAIEMYQIVPRRVNRVLIIFPAGYFQGDDIPWIFRALYWILLSTMSELDTTPLSGSSDQSIHSP